MTRGRDRAHLAEVLWSSLERPLLEAICEALVPVDLDGVAPRPSELTAFVERYVLDLSQPSRLGVRGALWLAEVATRVSTGRSLAHVGRAQRAELLVSFSKSRVGSFRFAMKVLSGLVLMALYADPSVRHHLGFP